MHRTLAVVALAAMPAASLAGGSSDLTFADAHILSVQDAGGFIEIEFSYVIQNIGSASVDLEGPDSILDNDNVAIQTLLSDTADLSGNVFAANGTAIFDTEVLAPGDTYEGMYTSGTLQLPNPTELGAFQWLVIDLVSTGDTSAGLGNNRIVLFIPTPSTAAPILAGVGLLASRRRR